MTPNQIMLRWHIQHNIVVIPKRIRSARITATFDVFAFSLSPEQMAQIDTLGN